MNKHEIDEKSFILGNKMAACNIIQSCLKLIWDEEDLSNAEKLLVKISQLTKERVGAIVALRGVCSDLNDNRWDDNLSLHDIIEKHVHRNLDL